MASTVVRYPIKKEIIEWAIEESQMDPIEIGLKFEKLKDWMSGDIEPTLKQIELFASYLKVPYGYMFLEMPPKDNVVRTEFRTINNVMPKVSKNLQDTLVIMQKRKEWMSDYRRENGWTKIDIIKKYRKYREKKGDSAEYAQQLLGLKGNWYENFTTYGDAYKFLRETFEGQGIIVMQNGIVGQDSRRKLDVSEFRAFLLYDEVAPLIFINSNDATSGRIFSLVHEFFHILKEQEDIFSEEKPQDNKRNEQKINDLVAQFLMPAERVRGEWLKEAEQSEKEPIKAINNIARLFKVSRHALAIRLQQLGYIDRSVVKEVAAEHSLKNNNSGGGDYYRTYRTRMSGSFFDAVTREVEAGRLSFTYAFSLLGGIKNKNYSRIKEAMIAYE